MRSALLALGLSLACLSACSTPGASAVPDRPAFRPIAGDEALLVWSAGIDAWMVDPKDAAVRDALRNVDARILEATAELSEGDVPAEAVQLAIHSLSGPWCLRAGRAQGEAAQRMPAWAQLAFREQGGDDARDRARALSDLLSSLGVPSLGVDEAFHGLSVVPVESFEVHHGVARDGRADTWVVAANGLRLDEPELGTLDLPAGVAPVLAYKLDYGALREIAAAFGGADAAAVFDVIGVEGLVIQGGIGQGADRLHSGTRTRGWVPVARASNSLAAGPIPARALELVPRDATLAWIGRSDLSGMLEWVRRAARVEGAEAGLPEDADPIALIAAMTGFDLERDLLDHVGETFGAYFSDASGGGGLISAVAFLEIADAQGFQDALAHLESLIEEAGSSEDEPALRVRHWTHAGADVATLQVPGLPIPLEVSWAQQGGWFFVGLTSQALAAALDQAARPDGDLRDNDAFRAEARGALDDLASLFFLDTPRFARDGYTVVPLLSAMLSNGLSSEEQPDRVPPRLAPGFAELVRGARATVSLGRIEGDDLVVTCQGDRSLLVHAAGIVGALGPLPMLIGIAIAGEEEQAEPVPFEIFDETEGMEDALESGVMIEVTPEPSEDVPPVPDEPK